MSSHKDFAQQAPGATGVDRNHPAERGYHTEIVDAQAGIVVETPPRKKVAIVGFAASSRNLAPFDDESYAIWGLNQLYRHIPRETRHFDIHANWREDNVEGTDHPQWLAECGMPVYMTQVEPSIPTSVRYPIEAVIRDVTGTDYFTSTVAFMVALALYERFEEIAIYGIDLIVGTEWDWQKACVEYLLGIAHARGVTVRIPPMSALLKQRWRYGYEIEPPGGLIKLTELQRRQGALTNERNTLIARLQTIDGALQENGYWGQIADLRSKGGHIKLNEDS